MQPQLCFFKDFDSFKVELEYLEIVYQSKPFRFTCPPNGKNRNFLVNTVKKIQLILPEMVLQSTNPNDTWLGFHVVDFCAQFEDLGMLSDFVARLKTVANYEQLKVPTCKKATDSEDDSFYDDEIYENDHGTNMIDMVPPVRFFFDSAYAAMNVTAQYFEITFQGVVYRFAHPQGNQARQYISDNILHPANTPRLWKHLLVKGVTLQELNPLTTRYIDGPVMDFYMVSEKMGTLSRLTGAVEDVGYVEVCTGAHHQN